MSQSYRRATVKKLQEILNTAEDPKVVIEAANVLAKYLPKPKQPKRRAGTPVVKKEEEIDMGMLVAAIEKKRKEQAAEAGRKLTEAEKQAADKEVLNSGSSAEVS